MKYLIAIALIACAASAQAKGIGHLPKLPKMGPPHEHKEHAAGKPKALKASKADPMSAFDDIGAEMGGGGAEPMFYAH